MSKSATRRRAAACALSVTSTSERREPAAGSSTGRVAAGEVAVHGPLAGCVPAAAPARLDPVVLRGRCAGSGSVESALRLRSLPARRVDPGGSRPRPERAPHPRSSPHPGAPGAMDGVEYPCRGAGERRARAGPPRALASIRPTAVARGAAISGHRRGVSDLARPVLAQSVRELALGHHDARLPGDVRGGAGLPSPRARSAPALALAGRRLRRPGRDLLARRRTGLLVGRRPARGARRRRAPQPMAAHARPARCGGGRLVALFSELGRRSRPVRADEPRIPPRRGALFRRHPARSPDGGVRGIGLAAARFRHRSARRRSGPARLGRSGLARAAPAARPGGAVAQVDARPRRLRRRRGAAVGAGEVVRRRAGGLCVALCDARDAILAGPHLPRRAERMAEPIQHLAAGREVGRAPVRSPRSGCSSSASRRAISSAWESRPTSMHS